MFSCLPRGKKITQHMESHYILNKTHPNLFHCLQGFLWSDSCQFQDDFLSFFLSHCLLATLSPSWLAMMRLRMKKVIRTIGFRYGLLLNFKVHSAVMLTLNTMLHSGSIVYLSNNLRFTLYIVRQPVAGCLSLLPSECHFQYLNGWLLVHQASVWILFFQRSPLWLWC